MRQPVVRLKCAYNFFSGEPELCDSRCQMLAILYFKKIVLNRLDNQVPSPLVIINVLPNSSGEQWLVNRITTELESAADFIKDRGSAPLKCKVKGRRRTCAEQMTFDNESRAT